MLQKLRQLAVNLTVYGMGDVAVQFASFLLLPLYVRILSPLDYGVIAVLLVIEQVLRVVYRWGVDAAFMRHYYDCADPPARQLLASTIFFFLLVVSGTTLAAGLLAAPWLSDAYFGSAQWTTPIRLVFVNAFLGSATFLPFHVLRIEGRARTYVRLTFSTNVATLVSKLLFVAVLRMGVPGVYWADFVVAAGLIVLLLPRYATLIRFRFSPALLRDCLSFGLPRVPHGVAHQVVAGTDRFALNQLATTSEAGIYSVGAGLGMGLRLFLSAFETAWAPFYFAEMKQPDAKATFRTVATYGIAILVLLGAGLAATATDLVRLMTEPRYYGAALAVPWVGLAVVLQGMYLLMSIGLNITKRTAYYPVVTGAAAIVAVVLNVVLVPRYGMLGAAWSTAAAYGTLAAVGLAFSQMVYPVPYEWGRIVRLAAAGVVAAFAGELILPHTVPALVGIAARGVTAVAVYGLVLAALGFFTPGERERARTIGAHLAAARRRRKSTDDEAMAPGPEAES